MFSVSSSAISLFLASLAPCDAVLILVSPMPLNTGHPWISFYDECPLKAEFSTLWSTNNAATPVIDRERVRSCCQSSSSESSSDNSEERDKCGVVDALTAAITQVRISEPKRSRLCSPAPCAAPTEQERSSNMIRMPCAPF